MMSTARCSSRHPFTANQWQELEHQAIIYKHLVSGVPIPPELLFPFRRSFEYSSTSTSSRLFPHQPNAMDWGCFQLGFGRKLDPEPGRCRRTDGKKWRCSKDAFADSKYCERHMHRGRNRSRKPAELTISATTSTTPPTNIPSSFTTTNNNSSSCQKHTSLHPFLYTHSSPSHGIAFSPQINSPHVTLDSPFDRYGHGLKNERAFFSEASGTLKNMMMPQSSLEDDPWQLTPLRMSSSSSSTSLASPKERNYSVLQSGGYSHLQLHGFDDDHSKSKQHEQEQHCFVWGTDFKSQKKEKEEPQEQPLLHFFN